MAALNRVAADKAPGLTVTGAAAVPRAVSARFDSVGKTYVYRMLAPLDRPASRPGRPPALAAQTAWVLPGPVSIPHMRRAAAALEGHLDFARLRLAGCSSKTSDRTVHLCGLHVGDASAVASGPEPWAPHDLDWGMPWDGPRGRGIEASLEGLALGAGPGQSGGGAFGDKEERQGEERAHSTPWDAALVRSVASMRALDRAGAADDPAGAYLDPALPAVWGPIDGGPPDGGEVGTGGTGAWGAGADGHGGASCGGDGIGGCELAAPPRWQSFDLVVSGSAFLYKQVRTMASLVASAGMVGYGTTERRPAVGRVSADDVEALLARPGAADPPFQPFPAPAHGLTLRRVHLPPIADLCRAAAADDARVARALSRRRDALPPGEADPSCLPGGRQHQRAAESARRVRRILWGHGVGPELAAAARGGGERALCRAVQERCGGELPPTCEAALERLLGWRRGSVVRPGMPVRVVLEADGLLGPPRGDPVA